MTLIDPDALRAALDRHGLNNPHGRHVVAALAPLLADAEQAIRQDERGRVVAAVEAVILNPFTGGEYVREDLIRAALRELGGTP